MNQLSILHWNVEPPSVDVKLNEGEEMFDGFNGDVVIVVFGAIKSAVTVDALVVVVTAVPAFPAISLKAIENAKMPVGSAPVRVLDNVQLLPPTLVAIADNPPIVPDALPSDSEDVKETVTIFPDFAYAVFALLDAIVRVVSVGAVLSTVKVAPLVGADVITLPAISVPVLSATVTTPFPEPTV